MAIVVGPGFAPKDALGLYKGKGNALTQVQAPGSPTPFAPLEGSPDTNFDTPLTATERKAFEAWKAKYAPGDSGEDYDLAGAFKAGLTPDPTNGHFSDAFKKPNHPTFSDQSRYARFAPEWAGTWDEAGAYRPSEARARAEAEAAAAAQTAAAEQTYSGLEAKRPGRYQLIEASKFEQWQAEWDKTNRSTGLVGDTIKLLDAGTAELEQSINEIVGMIPGIGKPLQALADNFDKFAYGSDGYSERLADVIDRDIATLTPETQQARGEQWWNAETNSLGSAWLNPRSYFAGVVESLPSTLATMAPSMWLARGAFLGALAKGATEKLAAAAAAKTALLAGALTEGGLGGAQASMAVRQAIQQMPREKILETEAAQALISQGMSPDEALGALTSDATTQAFVLGGVATGLFGGFGDRFLAKLIAEGVGGGLARRLVEGAVRGIVSEGLLEELPQEAFGQAAQNLALKSTVNPDQDLLEGVPNAALGGAAIGAAMGGAMGGVAGGFRPAGEAGAVDPSAPEFVAPRAPPPVPPVPPKGPLATALEHGVASAPQEIAPVMPVAGATEVLPDAEPVPLSPITVDTRPPEGANVVVEAEGLPRFTGRIHGYEQTETGEIEALVADPSTGELLQVPIEALRTAKLTDTMVADLARRDNPPIDRPAPELEPSSSRMLGKQPVQFPDAQHADLYDFGKQLKINKGLTRTLGDDVLRTGEMDPESRQSLADQFGVLPERLNEIADDYRYRVDRALKSGPGAGLALNMHGLHPDKLKIWRQERRIADLEGKRDGADKLSDKSPAINPLDVDAPAHEAATSPLNDLPEPTQAQKEAGNYQLGHFVTGGLDISIENPAGSERKGTDKGGKPWSVTMKSHYGYIKGTVGRDKDHIDVFVKQNTGELADDAPVFVVDQRNAEGGFDEHKVMLGYATKGQASNAYKANYTKSWKGLGAITQTTLSDFKAWLKDGDTREQFAQSAKKPKAAPDVDLSDEMLQSLTEQVDPEDLPAVVAATKAQAAADASEAAYEAALDYRAAGPGPEEHAAKATAIEEPKAERKAATDIPAPNSRSPEPAPEPADPFAGNKLFTADKVAAARARLKSKMGQLNSGIDPEVLIDGMTIAGAYIEAGVRDFAEYARQMTGDFGDAIKPYLLSFWEGARNYPGLDGAGMTSVAESAAAHAAMLAPLPASEASALGTEVAKPKTRARRSGRTEDRVVTQDWGVEHIDGYGNDPTREIGNDVKDAFLKDGVAFMRAVAAALEERGFAPQEDRRGKAMKAVSMNEAGAAVSGDVTLHMMLPETGASVMATLGGTSLRGAVPTTPSGVALMYRVSKKPGDTLAAGGVNRWTTTTLTAGEFADMIATEAMGTAPALAREPLETKDGDGTADNAQGPGLGQVDRGRGRNSAARSGDNPQPRAAQPDLVDLAAEQPRHVGATAGAADRADPGLRGAAADVGRDGSPDRNRDALHGRQGDGGARAADDGAGNGTGPGPDSSVKDPETTSPAYAGPGNFHITDPLKVVGGGPVARFEKNKAAITLYLSLKDEGRRATLEEQETLAGYTGWGSFGQELFQGSWVRRQPKPGWDARDAWLRVHLGQAQWESAQRSITNAHYTDPPTVLAMWQMAKRMGFTGGRVLEPSMGIGNFFGMMPSELAGRSNLTGVELDSLTGGMAQQLYPNANVSIMGYQESKTPDDFYDVVIGNWPFENTVIADRRYNQLSPFLHDYFFLKAVDQVRPGGLVIGITSKGTLDKKDPGIRNALARKAELVAAFRLPSGAFEDYAGTAVVTDIVILRKRAAPTGLAQGDWLKSRDFVTPTGETVSLNEYYHQHPDHVVGTIAFGHGTTFKRPGMIVNRPADMAAQLERIVAMVPEGAYHADIRGQQVSYITNHTDDREGALTETKAGFFVVRGEHLAPAEQVAKYAIANKAETDARTDQFRRLIGLRKAYAALIALERDPKADTDSKRADLRRQYEAFVKAHGRLRSSFGLSYLRKINDPFFPSLAALEAKDGDAYKPATILSKSTMRAPKPLEDPSVADAFVLARNASVNPSLAEIARLARLPEGEVRDALLKAGAVFDLPNGDIVPADIYLSGNVREKLRQARAGLEAGNADMQRNIDALQKVIPADIPYFNIEVQLGASWVPTSVYGRYISHMLNAPDSTGIKVTYSAGRWRAEIDGRLTARTEARAGFGTEYYPFQKLVNAALSNQTVRITRKTQDGEELDPVATDEANARIAKIREEFGEWLWSDPERRVDVEREYNEVRNAYATPTFDGSFLRFQGMALSLGNGPFDLRQHQVDAIWRALVTRKSLAAHEVGTGKTFTMGGIAVESRRYGIARKPLIFAHNANSKSVASEIQQMYPAAKVLYIDNLAPEQIDVRMRQIANDDWDAIVVPHSLISRFALKQETLMGLAAEEIAALEAEASAAAKEDGGDLTEQMFDDPEALKKLRSPTAKDLVKTRNRIIENIKKQAQRSSKDGAVAFEDLGVDMVMVDEAHEFKKPPFSTRMKIKGLQTATSDQSIALSFLTKYIRANNNGANVHLFTGTPVTNTLTEVFHMMRYIMAEEMADVGVDQWDGWFGSFAREVPDVELNAAAEFEAVTRLAGFINVPELRRLIGQYMDVVFSADMPEMRPRQTGTGKTLDAQDLTEAERAELLNGRTENAKDRPYKKVIISNADLTTPQQAAFRYVQGLARSFREMTGKDKRDVMLAGAPESPIIYEGLANKASFDVRLMQARDHAGQEGRLVDDPSSKASRVTDNVVEIYRSHPLATQVIFTELGISTSGTRSFGRDDAGNKRQERFKTFSTVQDIIARLVARGIPREQIALVDGSTSKDRRKEIADAMNRADIRVVIGSTDALGVGVNMQKNLRAMHHMDAPWMPGDLEQRNGRGHRQGNQWNTVLEYRYLTDRIDGRRWQVLAIKQRFITAFLKADDTTRVIEGDAAGDADSDILQTFAEAAGDPRLLIREKLKKKIDQIKKKQRLHGAGVVDAGRNARRLTERNAYLDREIDRRQPIADLARKVVAENAGKAFTIKLFGKTHNARIEANEALSQYVVENMRIGSPSRKIGEFGGRPVSIRWGELAPNPQLTIEVGHDIIETQGLSVPSLEAALRHYPDALGKMEAERANNARSISRMDEVAKEPFQRAGDLEQAEKQFSDIEVDMAANPVPPPSWLRSGTPVDTEILWNGKPFVVTGHRWNKDGWFVLAADAGGQILIPYAEARDAQGMPLYEERPFVAPEVIDKKDKQAAATAPDTGKMAPPDDGEYSIAEIPVAALSGAELGADAKDVPALRRAALAWYAANLVGEAAKTADGITVLFNRAGGKETVGGARDALALRAIPALRAILEKGRVVRRDPGTAVRTDTKRTSIGGRLAAVREARGMTQAAMAADLGLSPQRYGQYETGRSLVPPEVLEAFWRHTGADANYVLFGRSGGLPVDLANLLRDGRPDVKERITIAAPVSIAGQVRTVSVTVHATADGRFQYDLTVGALAPAGIDAAANSEGSNLNLVVSGAPVGWGEVGASPRRLTDAERDELVAIVREVSGLVDVGTMDTIALPLGAPGWGSSGPTTAAGFYSPTMDAIVLAEDSATPRTAYHESFHRLQRLFLTDAERRVLGEELPRLRRIVKGSLARRDHADGMSRKEIEAEAFAIYATGEARVRPHRALAAAWDRLAALVRRVRNFLTGNGFLTSDDVFDAARAGKVSNRNAAEAAPGSDSQFSATTIRRLWSIPAKAATIQSYRNASVLKANGDYAAAKSGDNAAAIRFVEAVTTPASTAELAALGTGLVYLPVIALEASGHNAIPWTMAAYYAAQTGGTVDAEVKQGNRAFHTGAGAMERLANRAVFVGPVQRGGRYVLVDDVTVMGSTLAELASHVVAGGGEVVAVVTLANSGRIATMAPSAHQIVEIERRFGDVVRNDLHIEPRGLTASEAFYLLNFRDADALRAGIAGSIGERRDRLGAKGVRSPGSEEAGLAPDPADGDIEPSIADGARDPAAVAKAVTTDLGGRWTDIQPKLLATVPLTYFAELARPSMSAVKEYLRIKRNMDAYRGDRHATADVLAQEWLKYTRLGFGLLPSTDGKAAAERLASLMHDSTLAGVDPSSTEPEIVALPGYAALRERYTALPPTGRALFTKVRDAYLEQAAETDKLIIDAVRKGQDIAKRKAAEDYEAEVARITASRLGAFEKKEALDKVSDAYAKNLIRSTYASKARLTALRKSFEANRVPAPYFPLARFGRYAVTVRDVDGSVVSFSRREKSADAQRLARDMREAYPGMTVETGVIDQASAGLRQAMDPRIIAEIESILSNSGVDAAVMDTIWQRYLQSMPDLSTRKRFIHRKGTAGFEGDALRAFSSHMFHAAHQMARLKFGIDLQEMLDQAAMQARKADDPTKGMTLINELALRHKWVMNPTGSSAVQAVTSAMFVWYLGATPAAALVNLTQTPMLGIPIIGARFGMARTSAALLQAARDFAGGRGDATKAGSLTEEERWAMRQFHETGLIDRTQSHDLAGVGETGVNYSPLRARVMAIISWGFHKTEVANREITALAAFRLAKQAGQSSHAALDTAHDLTWKVHFDYSNASRPRIMQGDAAKLLLVFQNYQVNMWYRIARDLHQAFKGESPQARKEARYQLAGIAGMMTLLGGVTGFFGFHVIMAILGMFLGDADDPYDFETQAKRHVVELFGPDIGGMILNGVPGQLLGVDLTSRIGMPDIFVRAPDNANLDGRDWMKEFIVGALGVVPNTAINVVDGFGLMQEGKLFRGLELMAPKAVKDLMQAYRFANEGLTTRKGDEIVATDLLGGWSAIAKVIGFTPARVAEAYDRNSALKNAETRIMDQRSVLLNQFAMAIEMDDVLAREQVLERIRQFNARPINQAVAITAETMRRSMAARQRNAQKREDGVLIQNEGLGQALRELLPARVH